MDRTVKARYRIEGVACYLLGFVTGILLLICEKDKFVRFHATQSTILSTIALILILIIPKELDWLGGLLLLIELAIWLFLMYKALIGEKYLLPVIGNISENCSESDIVDRGKKVFIYIIIFIFLMLVIFDLGDRGVIKGPGAVGISISILSLFLAYRIATR